MKRKRFQPKRWRKRYNYICLKCGAKRTTLDHARMAAETCTNCQPKPIDPNQQTMFAETQEVA